MSPAGVRLVLCISSVVVVDVVVVQGSTLPSCVALDF